jgi:uncharacterized circularly permuted ATP-grasp superfamily protein/uncharacterized alpha-E superfamily protein
MTVTDHYQPKPGGFDEAFAADGSLRPAWSSVAALLGVHRVADLLERRRRADRILEAEGAGHLVHDLVLDDSPRNITTAESRPWQLDPIPMVLDHAEFVEIAAGVEQRMKLVEALLRDVYGERTLLRKGVVSPGVLYSIPALSIAPAGAMATPWLVHLAVDVVRTGTGEWRVVQHVADAPSGLGYAVLNRAVMARVIPEIGTVRTLAPIASAVETLRRGLAAHAPASRGSPRTVVLSGGPTHSSYVEHSYLALHMGFHLVEGSDLVVRKNRVWLRALDGMEPVDVIYRRVEDRDLDPLASNTTHGLGVPGLCWAAQSGMVTMANSAGAALADDPALGALLDPICRALLGEAPRLSSLGATEVLASSPMLSGDGRLVPAAVVLRFHAIAGPDGITVVPGATGRVLADGDHPANPTMRTAKDLWVVGAPASSVRITRRGMVQPQVDFRSSVPRRAAEALYWVGRSAERAEFAARAARLIGGQRDQDPSLLSLGGGQWSVGAIALLRSVRSLSASAPGEVLAASQPDSLHQQIDHELVAAEDALVSHLGTLVAEATSVREFLSTTTGRVLGRLARVRSELIASADGSAGTRQGVADGLDLVLVDLAAFAGLTMESTVRGPAWRFLDLGRRVERSLVLLGTIEAGLGAATDALAFQPLAESVLGVNESLVAYRRQYRSDVELSAVIELLVGDDANPRSLAFQLDRLREHVASLMWREGDDLVHSASVGALHTIDVGEALGRNSSVDALVIAARGPVLEFADAVARAWFSAPANPMLIGQR